MSAAQHLPPLKQIRFVNNPGQPPSKRRRINAACLTCRKRKTRCAGERPVCSTCAKNGHKCLGYSDLPERKKRQAGAASAEALEEREPDTKSDYEVEDEGDDDQNDDLEPETFQSTTPQRRASEVDQKINTNDSSSPLRRRRASGNDLAHDRPRHSQIHEWDSQASPIIDKEKEKERSQAPRADYRRSVSFQGSSHGSHKSHGSHGGHGSSKRSPPHQLPLPHHNESHRVPYFRYFGPTAIVPGYKQMVVDVSSRDRRRSRGSSFSTASPNTTLTEKNLSRFRSQQRQGQNQRDSAFETPFELDELPVYDPNDAGQVHPIIINLIKTFFLHLGCNYPFLREQRVIRKIRDKRMEPILVDAMCALAARFSDLPIFSGNDDADDKEAEKSDRMARSEYGSFYAQRAKAATVDTFPCPSVAAVQACLLMAYEGFGADQDSALWMYLGIAIRMAVDLGLQKKISVDTTQGGSDSWFIRSWKGTEREGGDTDNDKTARRVDSFTTEEIRAEEQERADTFWAVFFLDRVISSGTGRPVTFRDDDFDLAFPEAVLDAATRRPAPFPILAQIIHLYGRVSDVLNNIQSVDDLTQEKMKRLGQMESDLTQLYQRQDARLNFNAPNFQAYVRAGQGTTFILLHFWFHALIIILHQPTLLTPFGSLHRRHQLLPNSHELSMSSAKTIADILAFAELIDPKSFIGNPFTSQPMYIAACAFLTESIANASLPASRQTSPPVVDARTAAKHSLLASNANQNYQRCYKSLQQLHLYWGGVRYILSALDQKSKGIWDCETFTAEEMQATNRKDSISHIPAFDTPGSPSAPPIAWSLTGTSNSANPSLTVLFQSAVSVTRPQQQQPPRSAATPPGNMVFDPIRQSLPEVPSIYPVTAFPQANLSAVRYSPQISEQAQYNTSFAGQGQYKHIIDDADGQAAIYNNDAYHARQQQQLHHGYQPLPFSTPSSHQSYDGMNLTSPTSNANANAANNTNPDFAPVAPIINPLQENYVGDYSYLETGPIPDVITFDSQEVDISQVPLTDIMPQWLEYLPSNVLHLFDENFSQ